MSKPIESSRLLIELDALFDTRAGVLLGFGEDTMLKAIEAGYYTRPFDIFPGIEDKVYREKYEERSNVVLKRTMITPMGYFLREFVKKTLQQIQSTPFHMKPVIVLNLHPYVLTDEECKFIITGVRSLTKGLADIETVSMPVEQITPSYLKQQISIYISYDYWRWFETQSVNGNLEKMSCPEVQMVGPVLHFKKPEVFKPNNLDAFVSMEEMAAPFIALSLLPIENFSAVVKIEKKA